MPTYVILTNWTDQGAHDARDTLQRADAAAEAITSAGGTLSSMLWTMGPYDTIAVADFPDDESASKAVIEVAREGRERTTTMRAFARDDISRIVG